MTPVSQMKKQELREGTELLQVTQQELVDLRCEPQDASRTPALNHTVCKDRPPHQCPRHPAAAGTHPRSSLTWMPPRRVPHRSMTSLG